VVAVYDDPVVELGDADTARGVRLEVSRVPVAVPHVDRATRYRFFTHTHTHADNTLQHTIQVIFDVYGTDRQFYIRHGTRQRENKEKNFKTRLVAERNANCPQWFGC